MRSSSYLLQQMERCLRLARACTDTTVAEKLRQMAKEFQDQADQAGQRTPLTADGALPTGQGKPH